MRAAIVVLGLAVLAAFPALGAPRPACAGPVEIADGQLLRVEKNGAIILTDGRAVHLEGIRLPNSTLDHAPQPPADQALSVIAGLTRNVALTLTAIAPKEDRYDRVRVQAFAGDKWVQGELLRRGLARVSIAPDRVECAAELFAIEAAARTAHAGLWALPAYRIRAPREVWRDIGTFQIVEGKVLNTGIKNGRAYINFGSDWRNDFTASVTPDDMVNFRRTGVDPRSYLGQTIRVRGWIQSLNGPEIEVANPQGIEVVQ